MSHNAERERMAKKNKDRPATYHSGIDEDPRFDIITNQYPRWLGFDINDLIGNIIPLDANGQIIRGINTLNDLRESNEPTDMRPRILPPPHDDITPKTLQRLRPGTIHELYKMPLGARFVFLDDDRQNIWTLQNIEYSPRLSTNVRVAGRASSRAHINIQSDDGMTESIPIIYSGNFTEHAHILVEYDGNSLGVNHTRPKRAYSISPRSRTPRSRTPSPKSKSSMYEKKVASRNKRIATAKKRKSTNKARTPSPEKLTKKKSTKRRRSR